MKSLMIFLSVLPLMAIAQNKKVQFEVDSNLFQNAENVVLVLEKGGQKDSIQLDSYKTGILELTGACSGFLLVTESAGVYQQSFFSIKAVQGDSVLLYFVNGRVGDPIFLTEDVLQVAQTLYLPKAMAKRAFLGPCDRSLPIMRGCRGMSGRNIPPEVFEKPRYELKSDLLGVPAEFEQTQVETELW